MWEIEYKKVFLKELSKLPENEQERIEKIVFDEITTTNPFQYKYIEKMKGYPDKYKIRVGNYRIGLTIDTKLKIIIFNRVAHRKDIYKIFP